MIVALWGAEKTGKSTLALTFPKPLVHFDLDVGGFKRAQHRFAADIQASLIHSTSYPVPSQQEKVDGTGKLRFRRHTEIVGYVELWSQIVANYQSALENPEVKTVVMDSATQLWTICHRALLQEKQETKDPGAPLRESLLSVEYGPANEAMKNLIFFARGLDKHLVLTHYPRDVYKKTLTEKGIVEYQTGEEELDGFRYTKDFVDLIIRTRLDKISVKVGESTVTKLAPIGKITTSGLALELLNMEFPEPTFEMIDNAVKMVRGEI